MRRSEPTRARSSARSMGLVMKSSARASRPRMRSSPALAVIRTMGSAPVAGLARQPATNFETVHFGHDHVEEHEVRLLGGDTADSAASPDVAPRTMWPRGARIVSSTSMLTGLSSTTRIFGCRSTSWGSHNQCRRQFHPLCTTALSRLQCKAERTADAELAGDAQSATVELHKLA